MSDRNTLTDDRIVVRIGVNAGSIFVATVTSFAFLLFLFVALVSIVELTSGEGDFSVGGTIICAILAVLMGWLAWNYTGRLVRKAPIAVFDREGLWIRTRKQYHWRWADIGAMYVWSKQAKGSRIRYLSFDPWPSAQVDEMCLNMNFRRLARIGCPVPTAAWALTVAFAAGIRPKRDEVIEFVQRVAPNVHVEAR